jgi:hypothetical protein
MKEEGKCGYGREAKREREIVVAYVDNERPINVF